MKNIKIKFALLLIIILFGIHATAYATLNITVDVNVPSSCNATDTDGVVHNYPKGDSYLAICALETVIGNGSISNVQLSNQFPSLGLFVTTMNNVTADPNSQYWAIYQNGSFANSGVASLSVTAGDIIMFQLHDFSDNNLGDQIIFNIHSLISNETENTIGSGGGNSLPVFDASTAVAYLANIQYPDGSFGGSDLYTDWASIALVAGNISDSVKKNILNYMSAHNTISSILTDNERHSMALLALGENPYAYSDNKINYIEAIVSRFDGTQFGDIDLINDDIFALIPLASSGYTGSDDIIIKDIAFILSKQKPNGSWEESVDMTAATIQALKPFEEVDGVFETIVKASNYLTSEQKSNGSWNNSVFSTSWAMQAMNTLGGYWTKSSSTPVDYLATQQSMDGAVLPLSETSQNRIWATSYAIPAVLGKTWISLFHPVPKPVPPPLILTSPTMMPIMNNTLVVVPAKKKSAFIAPIHISSPAITSKVSPPIIQQIPTDTLSATAEKSGVPIPIAITVIVALLASAAGIIRVIRHPR